jgi:hypothetical protein
MGIPRTATSVLVGLALAAAAFAAEPANPGWEKVKSLVGEWEARPTAALPHLLQVGFNGTAVMETIGDQATQMVTLYHPDGSNLLMTHYCSMGNQPRMRSRNWKSSPSPTSRDEHPSPEQLRMTRLVMSFRIGPPRRRVDRKGRGEGAPTVSAAHG